MKRLFHLLKRLIHDRRTCRFYGYDWSKGRGRADGAVQIFTSWDGIPRSFRKVVMPLPGFSAMSRRLKRGEAALLCCSEDGRQLDAYGWVQKWRPFRRKFGKVAQNGMMLGPYWTAPDRRGRGVYGRLLSHSLTLCPPDQPVFIYTSPENTASQRGIEKAGFHFLGEWKLRVWVGIFSQLRRTDPKI